MANNNLTLTTIFSLRRLFISEDVLVSPHGNLRARFNQDPSLGMTYYITLETRLRTFLN